MVIGLANTITITRILFIPVFVIILYLPIEYNKLIAAIVFIILSLTDALDGYVARKRNEITAMGKFIDPIADKLLIAAALIFLIGHGVEAWMAFIIIAREILVSGIRLVAVAKGNVVHASSLGKIKTVSQIVGILAVLLESVFVWWLMLIATLFTIISGLDYFRKLSHLLKE